MILIGRVCGLWLSFHASYLVYFQWLLLKWPSKNVMSGKSTKLSHILHLSFCVCNVSRTKQLPLGTLARDLRRVVICLDLWPPGESIPTWSLHNFFIFSRKSWFKITKRITLLLCSSILGRNMAIWKLNVRPRPGYRNMFHAIDEIGRIMSKSRAYI